MIEQELVELEKLLIETPDDMNKKEYEELIEKTKNLRAFLKFTKEQ